MLRWLLELLDIWFQFFGGYRHGGVCFILGLVEVRHGVFIWLDITNPRSTYNSCSTSSCKVLLIICWDWSFPHVIVTSSQLGLCLNLINLFKGYIFQLEKVYQFQVSFEKTRRGKKNKVDFCMTMTPALVLNITSSPTRYPLSEKSTMPTADRLVMMHTKKA
jgi:hypothetical protein